MNNFYIPFFLITLGLTAQNKLSLSVEGVKSSNGEIMVAIYTEADAFLKFDKVYSAHSVKAEKGVTQLAIDNLPNGTYAVAVFHDANGNQKLDTNWLGIPKEAVGFSIAKMKTFGPPSFEECSFTLHGDRELKIAL